MPRNKEILKVMKRHKKYFFGYGPKGRGFESSSARIFYRSENVVKQHSRFFIKIQTEMKKAEKY